MAPETGDVGSECARCRGGLRRCRMGAARSVRSKGPRRGWVGWVAHFDPPSSVFCSRAIETGPTGRQTLHWSVIRAGVTQLAECLLPKQNVAGSNPVSRSTSPFMPRATPGMVARPSLRVRAEVPQRPDSQSAAVRQRVRRRTVPGSEPAPCGGRQRTVSCPSPCRTRPRPPGGPAPWRGARPRC